VGIDPSVLPQVTVHAGWPWLTAACGLLVLLAGLLVAVRGHRWSVMSARYETPVTGRVDDEQARQRVNTSLWQALDRGDDPTTASRDEDRPTAP
jgi:uncharacterized membrane protein (TIGR02234 family)